MVKWQLWKTVSFPDDPMKDGMKITEVTNFYKARKPAVSRFSCL
jgi:hypothetical protein